MYLKQLHIKGFRCIEDLAIEFHKGINILIGENDTGKTAVLDALRIGIGLGDERRDIYITSDDLFVGESGQMTDIIEFQYVFGGLSPKEEGIFIELLKIIEDDEESDGAVHQVNVRFTYNSEKDRVKREYWGGENEGQNIPSEVLSLIHHVYLDALRDASRCGLPAHFRAGRGPPLRRPTVWQAVHYLDAPAPARQLILRRCSSTWEPLH